MHKIILVIICAALSPIFTGCAEKYPLNGIWTGDIDGETANLIFIDDICFLKDDFEILSGKYTYYDGAGSIIILNNNIDFSVSGNNMTVTNDLESYSFTKDFIADSSPVSIRGLWYADDGWVFAFAGDYVYVIDDDGDATFGKLSFGVNSGSFKCEYWYDVDFSIKSGNLNAEINTVWGTVENIVFSRKNNQVKK
ncbi:MAG: hypothetical protein FWD47_04315 [Treponema sp.]|nr:hypothetical protein [Treponema sp.]